MFYNLQVSHFYYPAQVLGPGFNAQPNICLLLPAISDQLDLLLSTWGGTYTPVSLAIHTLFPKGLRKKRNHRLIQKESHKMIVSQCSTAPCSLQSIFMAIVSQDYPLSSLILIIDLSSPSHHTWHSRQSTVDGLSI